jgi:hypothetical protein
MAENHRVEIIKRTESESIPALARLALAATAGPAFPATDAWADLERQSFLSASIACPGEPPPALPP